jgi:hypothetical protein
MPVVGTGPPLRHRRRGLLFLYIRSRQRVPSDCHATTGSNVNAEDTDQAAHRLSTIRRRAWRPTALAVALVALAVGLAACGGGSPQASGGSSPPGGSISSASSSAALALKYAQCMRSHGITDFPNPTLDGEFDIQGLNLKDNPQWQSAQQACQTDLAPGGSAKRNSSVNVSNELNFASCMRAHGITDFPDPNGQGVVQITNPTGLLDPNSPQFETANNGCQPHGSVGVPIAIENGS